MIHEGFMCSRSSCKVAAVPFFPLARVHSDALLQGPLCLETKVSQLRALQVLHGFPRETQISGRGGLSHVLKARSFAGGSNPVPCCRKQRHGRWSGGRASNGRNHRAAPFFSASSVSMDSDSSREKSATSSSCPDSPARRLVPGGMVSSSGSCQRYITPEADIIVDLFNILPPCSYCHLTSPPGPSATRSGRVPGQRPKLRTTGSLSSGRRGGSSTGSSKKQRAGGGKGLEMSSDKGWAFSEEDGIKDSRCHVRRRPSSSSSSLIAHPSSLTAGDRRLETVNDLSSNVGAHVSFAGGHGGWEGEI